MSSGVVRLSARRTFLTSFAPSASISWGTVALKATDEVDARSTIHARVWIAFVHICNHKINMSYFVVFQRRLTTSLQHLDRQEFYYSRLQDKKKPRSESIWSNCQTAYRLVVFCLHNWPTCNDIGESSGVARTNYQEKHVLDNKQELHQGRILVI